jgi:2-oxoglutaroyl-CoA hydrolase
MSQSFNSTLPELLAELDGFRVEVDHARERADIVLHRPPLNVVTMRQREQMRAVIEELDRDAGVRVIVIRSEGKHFSSGGDIRAFLDSTPEKVSQLARNVAAPERCSKPVVAAMRGYCFGVGFELTLACDFRIVTDTTQVALPEQRIGQIPGSGGSARLVKMIGLARTKDMTMRSRRVPGALAAEWGIALECVADADLEARTDALVEELRGFSPLAQRTLKEVLNAAEDAPLSVAIEMEGQAYGRLRSSDDFREGVEAFYEKRKAVFRGT